MSAVDASLSLRVRGVVAGASAALAAARQRLDDLNVYPVPDGDTGTNLSRTLQAVVDALEREPSGDPAGLAHAVSRAALMGARGNSGIILSQVLRGLCERLARACELDAATVAEALRAAADAAYRAVHQPVEGTMLTVVREMAEAAEAAVSAGAALDETLERTLAAARDAVARTPELLAVLRQAGVVDAGGAGLYEIARGATAALRGEDLPAAEESPPPAAAPAHAGYSAQRYCTSFLIEGAELDIGRLEASLAPLGDSLVVVGDRDAVKVHVHTDDPGAALSVGTAAGAIGGVEIADMHAQTAERSRRLSLVAAPADEPDQACDAVCVVAGAGNRRLVEELGCRAVVEGGQTLNPSTGELVEAIDGCRAREAVLLPNNDNVLLAAEHAVAQASRAAAVVPTRSIAAGLAAMVAFDPARGAAANAEAMREAADAVRTGALTRAVRDAVADGVQVRRGEYVALVDGTVIAADPAADAALRTLAERLLDGGAELLTALCGDGGLPDTSVAAVLRGVVSRHAGLELEVHDGGQPHYPVLLLAE